MVTSWYLCRYQHQKKKEDNNCISICVNRYGKDWIRHARVMNYIGTNYECECTDITGHTWILLGGKDNDERNTNHYGGHNDRLFPRNNHPRHFYGSK